MVKTISCWGYSPLVALGGFIKAIASTPTGDVRGPVLLRAYDTADPVVSKIPALMVLTLTVNPIGTPMWSYKR